MASSTVAVADTTSSLWLERDLPLLDLGAIAVAAINFTIITVILGFDIFTRSRFSRVRRAARENGSTLSAEERRAFKKRISRVDRIAFKLAIVNMIVVVALALSDAWLCAGALSNAGAEDDWNIGMLLELVMYSLGIAALFISAFVVVPMLQMIVATYFLARFSSSSERRPMSSYIPAARGFSTMVALLWTLVCLGLSFYWPPISENVTLRFVVLEGAWGSALAWLDAAFAFNFCAKKLATREVAISNSGVRQIVAVFGETVKTVHWNDEKKPLLP